jgi:hypothetical protein
VELACSLGFILIEIYEPFNHIRQVVGFDTFAGFAKDMVEVEKVSDNLQMKDGGLKRKICEELNSSIKTFDSNRPLKLLERILLVKGDASLT